MMEFGGERVASRPLFSASRRKLPFAERTHCLVAAVPSGTSRRDADWCDRDGRAPRFKRIVGLALSRARSLHNFGFNFVRREVAGVVRTEAADVKEAENRIHV